jgi:cytochrome c peroxidase
MKSWVIIMATGMIFVVGAPTARAADDPPGLAIFKKGGCNECHSISALSVQKEAKKKAEGATETAADTDAKKKKKDPPDLSGVGLEHDAKWISAYLNKEETLNDEKHEKRFKGSEADRRTVAMFLAGLKTKPKETPAATEGKKEGGE